MTVSKDIQSTDYRSIPLAWRKLTGMHKKLGARAMVLLSPAFTTAQSTVWRFQYEAGTIDRVIGLLIDVKTSVAGVLTLTEQNTGQTISITTTNTGLRSCNLVTLNEEIYLTMQHSAGSGSLGSIVAFNFEVPGFGPL